MIGFHYIYKVLTEKRSDYLVKTPAEWFIGQEKREFKKVVSYLSKYGQLPPPPASPPDEYEDHPIDYFYIALRKRYLKKLVDVLRFSEISEENIEEFILNFVKEYEKTTSYQTSDFVITPKELPTKTFETIEFIRRNKVAGLLGYSTGYPSLDLLTGGYIKGDLFVFVARMKMGKTMYLLNSVLNMLRENISCLFISMEMSFSSVIRRLLSLEFKNPNFIVQNRIVSSFMDQKIKSISYPFFYVNGSILSDIVDILSLINVYKPDVVLIDGAYLLPIKSSLKTEWERATSIIRGLRNIALKTNLPVIITYQLNRQSIKAKEVGTEHISFTDAVGQSASVVVAIVNSEDPDKKKFAVIANREGPADVAIEVNWDWIQLNFNETSTITRESIDIEDVEYAEEEL